MNPDGEFDIEKNNLQTALKTIFSKQLRISTPWGGGPSQHNFHGPQLFGESKKGT
jgi:hypothetical protein